MEVMLITEKLWNVITEKKSERDAITEENNEVVQLNFYNDNIQVQLGD